jgi:acyl carrier protein
MNVKEKVIEIVSTLSNEGENVEVNEDTTLSNDLEFDSLTIFEAVVEIESTFDIEIPDEYLDVEELDKVGNIIEIVNQLV